MGELGGLAKADWQQTGGQRVERSGMSGFDPAEQASNALQSSVGSQASRLVEEQNAMNHWTGLRTIFPDIAKAIRPGLYQA